MIDMTIKYRGEQTVDQVLVKLGYSKSRACIPPCTPEKREAIASLWEFILNRTEESGGKENGQRPVAVESILEKLAVSRIKGEELVLFSPWGPRYKTLIPEVTPQSPEIDTIGELNVVLRKFRDLGYKTKFLLMPADSYGTEINGLSPVFVSAYFNSLSATFERNLTDLTMEIKSWSAIKASRRDRYLNLKEEISKLPISPGTLGRARRKAIWIGIAPEASEIAARLYIWERLIEARMISEEYDPIKLSLAKKENDEQDGYPNISNNDYLKRIYIVRNRATWMPGELPDIIEAKRD